MAMFERRKSPRPVTQPAHDVPLRVLIVDDEPTVCDFVDVVLSSAGYATEVAFGSADALTQIDKEGPFDLLVTDLMMPQMRGDELARRVRQMAPSTRVLYFTAYSDRLFQDKVTLWADEAFLDKPSSIDGLLKAVALLLDERPSPQHAPSHLRDTGSRSVTNGSDETCESCRSRLEPPTLANGVKVPPSADYVCLKSGRAYWWIGTPPKLTMLRRFDPRR